MGCLVESEALNRQLRSAVAPDFARANAWELAFDEQGNVVWISDDEILTNQPAASGLQRIEDWLFAHLPLEDEM